MRALSSSDPDLDLFDAPPPTARIPYGAWSMAVALLVGYAPIATLFGLCALGRGARWYAPRFAGLLPVYFVVFAYVVHAALVWPIANLVYPGGTAERLRPLARVGVAAALLSLPLFSYAYYLGTFRAGIDYGDVALTVFPAAVIAALCFEATRKPWLFSLTLSLSTFIPLFVLNDILGPVPAVWNYASRGVAFYWLRLVLSVVAVALALRATIAQARSATRAAAPSPAARG